MRFTTRLGAALTCAAIAAALGVAALGQPGPAAAQDLPGGTWGPALAVNLAALPPAGEHFTGGSIQALSCASPGSCAAIGTYGYTTNAGADTPYPFVLSETGGTWGTPAAVPGITSSTPDQSVTTPAVSCAGPGECAASWTYEDAHGDGHAYLIDESRGAWGRAQPVTIGTAGTWLSGVSCPAAGDCTAAGHYRNGGAGTGLPFVMDSAVGRWGAPREVAGVAGLSSPSPAYADLTSVSCASAGNCVAGGSYDISSTDGLNHEQPFLAIETGGSWGQAQHVAGVAALDPGGWANLRSVSCVSSGDCTAIGFYFKPGVGVRTWVARASGGSWGPAQQLPAPATSGPTLGKSLSCSPQGYCAVVGIYPSAAARRYKAFVTTYANGAWTAQDVPGVVGTSGATTVSCGAPGYCTAAGFYYPPGSGSDKSFIANDVNGTWANAQDVAGMPARYLPEIDGLSCTTPGYCTAFVGRSFDTTFTVSEATAATITLRASAPTLTYGDEEAETLTATVTSPAGGTPTGTVTVTDGELAACQITLTNAAGSCTLPATALPGGTGQLTATYRGDASYAAASSTATVTVAKAATTPVMTVSRATVTFGTRYHAVVSVTVAPQFTGTPTGTLFIYLNGSAMCETLLTGGKAACAVPEGQNGGRYKITASYGGDGNFAASTAAAKYLTVAREKTSTSLALSKATITYGHETAEKLTVTISSPVPNRATGKVTIKAGRTTVCVITLKRGSKSTGSCTLKATQLRSGTYQLTASYPGDGNYAPSNSSRKSLKVVA